jgi:putative Holliday junction resolvase
MGRVLGIDYGTKRLGFALSDETAMLAMPLRVTTVRSLAEAIAVVCRTAIEKEVVKIVVGFPMNMDNTKGPMAEEVERFVKELAGKCGLPVEVWDERMSTGLVERMLLQADVSRSRRKEVRDKLAAQVILQGYLDATGTRVQETESD